MKENLYCIVGTQFPMANHKSARKCIRKTERQTEVNKNRVSRMRTFVRKAEEAIAGGSPETAKLALVAMEKELMRGVRKGTIHQNTASRKVSRLSKKIKLSQVRAL